MGVASPKTSLVRQSCVRWIHIDAWRRWRMALDWLGCYKPALDYWTNYGLSVERVDLGLETRDPIDHRIQVSYQCPEAGRRIYGYGESSYEMFAYEKAIAELIERESLFQSGAAYNLTSTNGLAAHRMRILAEHSAKVELQERDSFLRHWVTKTPMLVVKAPADDHVKRFRRVIEDRGLQLILAQTYLGVIQSMIAIIHDPQRGGFVLGSSGAGSIKCRTRKAVSEAFLSLHSRRQNDIIDWDRSNFDTHANYWFFHKKMPDWLIGCQKIDRPRPKDPSYRFYLLKSHPIPVVAATSPDLLQLWTGPTPPAVAERIKDQYDLEANFDPHPFP